MFDFNVLKFFFCIITRTGKVLHPLPSLGWVKINSDGAARG